MVLFDQKDCDRLGKAIVFHLQRGEMETCMTMLKTLQVVQGSGAMEVAVNDQLPRVYTKIAQEAKEMLTCQRKELEDRRFQTAFAMYEQCLMLSMQTHTASMTSTQDVYYNPNEVAHRVATTPQNDTTTNGDSGAQVVRPFGGEQAVPVS